MARRKDLYQTTHNTRKRQISKPRRDSNPQSQQASGCRPTYKTARLRGSAYDNLLTWNRSISNRYLKNLCIWNKKRNKLSFVWFLLERRFPKYVEFSRPTRICYAYCTLMGVTCWRCKLKYSLTWRFRKTCAVQDQPTIILICCQIAHFSSRLKVMDGEVRQLKVVGLVFAKQCIVDTNTKRSHSCQVRVVFSPLQLLMATLIPYLKPGI